MPFTKAVQYNPSDSSIDDIAGMLHIDPGDMMVNYLDRHIRLGKGNHKKIFKGDWVVKIDNGYSIVKQEVASKIIHAARGPLVTDEMKDKFVKMSSGEFADEGFVLRRNPT